MTDRDEQQVAGHIGQAPATDDAGNPRPDFERPPTVRLKIGQFEHTFEHADEAKMAIDFLRHLRWLPRPALAEGASAVPFPILEDRNAPMVVEVEGEAPIIYESMAQAKHAIEWSQIYSELPLPVPLKRKTGHSPTED